MQSSPCRQGLTRLAILAALALAVAGCGHPATREECEELFNKNAEITLRDDHITDPATIAERTASARALKGEEFTKSCMGKRITDRAMDCARKASTAKDFDRCL